jgi:hypothetical protein
MERRHQKSARIEQAAATAETANESKRALLEPGAGAGVVAKSLELTANVKEAPSAVAVTAM